jgi:hypothetical protein
MLLRNQHNMSYICGDMVGNRLRRLAGDMLGNAPGGSHFYLGISQSVSATR